MADKLFYTLYLFTLEGHTTWHATIAKNRHAFDLAVKGAKLTGVKEYKIDRQTGEIV